MNSLFASHQKTLVIAALLAVLTAVCAYLEPRFISVDGIGLILKYAGLYGLIALGVSFVIITGGIDLSIGSWIGLSAVLFPEPRAAPEVGNVKNQILNRILWIFECGRDGQSFTMLEE
jgi:ribose/xylose/arabinose/galactoside ABC-type transport system permease subunit